MTDQQITIIRQNADKVYFPFLGEDNIFTNGIKISRVAFKIPGTDFVIYWYGLLIALGLALAVIYGFSKLKKHGINPDRAIDACIAGFLGAIVGARLYYVLFSWDEYKNDILKIFDVRDGGLAIYGGIIGAVLCGGIMCKIRKVNLPAILDLTGIGFLIGQSIGRWGNFFNQEAFGDVTTLPWGMTSYKIMNELAEYNYTTSYVLSDYVAHPCFLYESIWCALGFVILNFYLKHRKFDGEVFLMYIGWYGLGRFFIEGLRTDSLYLGANLRVSQLLAGTCVLAAFILIIIFRGMVRRSGEYKFYYETEESKMLLAEYEESLKKEKSKKTEVKEKSEEVISEPDEVIDEEIDVTDDCCDDMNDVDDIDDCDDIDDID